ncbi:MAG: DUF4105 domain-containing protein [Pseudomonadota bacterium]
MPRPTFNILIATLTLFSAPASAERIDTLIDAAQSKNLDQRDKWLALGHYKHGADRGDDNASYIDDDGFFLADTGERDPAAELIATLQQLPASKALSDEQRNQHPRCRYPARYQWLSKELDFEPDDFGSIQCPDFTQWLDQVDAHSVTLVYAASYLNSPSSMYGHTLMRLDPPDKEEKSEWLSWAVNFGARVPSDDNAVVFAYRGIFGGYPGHFSVLSYLEKIQEYNHIENRDLWEYELNLTPEETRALTLHLWELKDIQFDYFFFDENCSYRLLELLEVARPGTELTDDFSFFAIPIDTVRSIEDAGFVGDSKRRASRTRLLRHQIAQLEDGERRLALDLIESHSALEDEQHSDISGSSRTRAVKTASDFLNYRFRKVAREDTNVEQRFALLKAMSQLPKPGFDPLPRDIPPENGHESSMVSLAAGREADSDFVDLTLRLSFHDLIDNRPGFDHGASINMGEFTLRQDEHEDLELQRATLIDIHSYTPRDAFFKPTSWEATVGGERRLGAGGSELIFQGSGGAGLSYRLWPGNITYALVGARAEYNEQHFDSHAGVAASLKAGTLIDSPLGTTRIEWQKQRFDNHYEREISGLHHNLPLGKDIALTARYEYHDYSDTRFHSAQLGLRHFF